MPTRYRSEIFSWTTHIVFLIILSLVACGGENDYSYNDDYYDDSYYDDDYYDDDYYDDDYYDDDGYYEIEGRITSIVDSRSFLLRNVLVIHGPSTRFEYGNPRDLAVGRRVEVKGARTGSGTIIAREIEFEDRYYDD